jgi:hypothetical protein
VTKYQFKDATDVLFEKMGPNDLSVALGCSPAKVRQARMDTEKSGYRTPPEGWEPIVARIALNRARAFLKVAESLSDHLP